MTPAPITPPPDPTRSASRTGMGAPAAAGDEDALGTAVAALMALGAEAIAERAEHGKAWGVWADWAWNTEARALPASRRAVLAFLDHAAQGLLPDDIDAEAVIVAVNRVHIEAGYPPPAQDINAGRRS